MWCSPLRKAYPKATELMSISVLLVASARTSRQWSVDLEKAREPLRSTWKPMSCILFTGPRRGNCKSVSYHKFAAHPNHSHQRLSHTGNVSIKGYLLVYP